jgi:uncharacterized protein YcnI
MRTTFLKHAVVSTVTTTAVVLAVAGIASAHVDPDPIAVQAGSAATVGFKVEHGCDGSPTTGMKFQIPAGVTDAAGVDKDGWTSTVTGDSLEFTGGPLAADEEDHFDISFTAPATPGEISFPVIQTCEQGEIPWIEPIVEGQEEPERPAPTIKLTAGAPTAEDLTPAPEAVADTVVATGSEATVATTAADSDDDSSNTGTIITVIVAAVIVIGGGAAMMARRRSSGSQGSTQS